MVGQRRLHPGVVPVLHQQHRGAVGVVFAVVPVQAGKVRSIGPVLGRQGDGGEQLIRIIFIILRHHCAGDIPGDMLPAGAGRKRPVI